MPTLSGSRPAQVAHGSTASCTQCFLFALYGAPWPLYCRNWPLSVEWQGPNLAPDYFEYFWLIEKNKNLCVNSIEFKHFVFFSILFLENLVVSNQEDTDNENYFT